jgi:hypothetical protein
MNDIKDQGAELIQLPVCYIGWIAWKDPEPYLESTVNTPIYHSLDRESLLCTINVLNNGSEAARILGGTAMFLVGAVAG